MLKQNVIKMSLTLSQILKWIGTGLHFLNWSFFGYNEKVLVLAEFQWLWLNLLKLNFNIYTLHSIIFILGNRLGV